MSWSMLQLDEVAEVAAGNPAPQESGDFVEDGHVFIRMQDVGREHHTADIKTSTDRVSDESVSKYRLRLFPVGSVLIPKSGASVNLNHRAMLGCDAYVVSHLAVVVPNRERLLPEYLYYWSLSYDPRSQAQTTSLPSLPLSLIKAALIPVPLLSEQRRIVDILSRAESIVRLRRDAEKKAAELIPALFLDMFGDPATNPKGWPISPFGELVENKDGMRKPIKSSDRDNRHGPYPYYGASGIIDTYDDYLFEGEHLLIAEDGANLLSRSTPIAFLATGKYWVNNHAHVVAANGKANLTFLECLLNLRDLKDSITGSAQPKLNQANLNGIAILNCPTPMQERFEDQVAQIRSIQSQQSAATAKAQATFDALLAQVFAN